MKKTLFLIAALLTAMTAWASTFTVTNSGNIKSGSGINYTYDSETGELTLLSGEFNSSNKWGDEVVAENVTSVTATSEVSFTEDCSGLFYRFINCESMDLSNVNTSGMEFCYNMFGYCCLLTSLDISDWNTANVTYVVFMFADCSSLRSLDLSGWNTAKVTNMEFMFAGCNSLTSLDLSGWNTANVGNMKYMFSGCSGLTAIYVGEDWNTNHVESSDEMFSGCSSLVGGKGTTYDENFTDKTYARIDGGPDNPGYLTARSPHSYTFDSATGALTLLSGDFNQDYKWGDEVQAWAVKSVTATSEVSFTGDCSDLFSDFNNCMSMDLSNVNTTGMTAANYMFYYCSALTSLDLSGWNTGNVTEMIGMFQNCSKLTSLDLSGWNTANVGNMHNMFSYCSRLSTIYVSEDWSTESVYNSNMFTGCTSLVGGKGTTYDSNHIDKTYARIDGGPSNPGYLTGPRYTFDSETGALTLNWGEFNKDNKWGSEVTNTVVKSVTATSEVSFTGDCSNLFNNFRYCESMDLSSVNTSGMTKATHLFSNCSKLTSLDLSAWNTEGVTDMNNMFYSCSKLTSLDLSGWNTGNVTNMYGMFSYCSDLISLDLSGFNTAKVTDMSYMFNYCSSLTSLDLSGFNTDSVTNMKAMFQQCKGLTLLDISGWNTGGVTNMSYMFSGCSSLTSLNVSSFNTEGVTNMSSMFQRCLGLTSLDLSGFNTAKVTDMSSMFSYSSGLTTIYVGEEWSVEKVTSSGFMFTGCTKLVGGMGTEYDSSHTDKTYAHIDGGPDNPGYFTAKSPALRGDVDGNGSVGIGDITALIDYILSGDATDVNVDAADCDQNGTVGIGDVTALIDYILNGSW